MYRLVLSFLSLMMYEYRQGEVSRDAFRSPTHCCALLVSLTPNPPHPTTTYTTNTTTIPLPLGVCIIASTTREPASGDGDDGHSVPLGRPDAGAGIHGIAARADAAGGQQRQDCPERAGAHVPGEAENS